MKKLAVQCKFGSFLDAFVVNKFISGLGKGRIFERLCEEDETITMERALKIAIIAETKYTARSKTSDESEVNYIHKQKSNNNSKSDKSKHVEENKVPCKHCGWKNHKSDACKFSKAKCHTCGKIGHLASICKNKSKEINFIDSSDETCEINEFFSSHSYSFNARDIFSTLR